MDLSAVVGVAVGGVIALLAQVLTARTAQRAAQAQIDFERWDSWRKEAADVWAAVAATARRMDSDFSDLSALNDAELERVRRDAREVVRLLDRLSALTLSHRVFDWAAELAQLFTAVTDALPTHRGCDDEEAGERYQQLRHLLHERFEWNDGSYSTQVERLRDALRRATEPPERPRHGFLVRSRRRPRGW